MVGEIVSWTAIRIECVMKEFKMGNGIISERAIGLGLLTLCEILLHNQVF